MPDEKHHHKVEEEAERNPGPGLTSVAGEAPS